MNELKSFPVENVCILLLISVQFSISLMLFPFLFIRVSMYIYQNIIEIPVN